MRRVRVHAKQHQLQYFCPCRMNSVSRDTIYSHQKKYGASAGSHYPLYTVDSGSYGGFCQAMGWNPPPPFTPCVPVQSGSTQRQEPAPAPRPEPVRRPRTPPRRCPSPVRAVRPPPRRVSPPRRRPASRSPPPRRPTSPPRVERQRPSRTPPRERVVNRDRPPRREVSPPVFACRDYRYQEPSLDEQRRTVAVRLGFIPRSHLRAHSPNFRAAELENEARDRERELELIRRELQRAPANDPDRRSLELQIQHLDNVIRRSRAAARRLRSPSPANKRERR